MAHRPRHDLAFIGQDFLLVRARGLEDVKPGEIAGSLVDPAHLERGIRPERTAWRLRGNRLLKLPLIHSTSGAVARKLAVSETTSPPVETMIRFTSLYVTMSARRNR